VVEGRERLVDALGLFNGEFALELLFENLLPNKPINGLPAESALLRGPLDFAKLVRDSFSTILFDVSAGVQVASSLSGPIPSNFACLLTDIFLACDFNDDFGFPKPLTVNFSVSNFVTLTTLFFRSSNSVVIAVSRALSLPFLCIVSLRFFLVDSKSFSIKILKCKS
jgi:hypothetical protein